MTVAQHRELGVTAERMAARTGGSARVALRRLLRNRLAVASLVVVAVLLVVAPFAPVFATHDPARRISAPARSTRAAARALHGHRQPGP